MSSTDNAKFSLLVVDDNEDNREILAARLGQLGYTNVTLAVDGHQALERLERSHFDLVLLDLMMPGINGIEVLETLRGKQRLASLPVIMVSAASERDSVVRCIELGAEDYLTKPVNVTMLRARVSATLEKKRLRDSARERMVELGYELAAARELQRGMVPLDHERSDSPVEIHFLLEPARELGGDLCDFLFGDADTLWVGLGDVSGKGVAAAIFMARTWSVLRSLAGRAPRAVREESDPGKGARRSQSRALQGEREIDVLFRVPRAARPSERRARIRECRSSSAVPSARRRRRGGDLLAAGDARRRDAGHCVHDGLAFAAIGRRFVHVFRRRHRSGGCPRRPVR